MRLLAGAVACAVVLIAADSAASSGTKLHVFARNGTVVAYRTHFRCRGSCSLSAMPGSVVLLVERPNRFFSFSHWAGACQGDATACAVSLTSSAAARAVFTRNRGTAVVTIGGAGAVRVVGAVTSNAGCEAASGDCNISLPAGKVTTLAAVPDPGGSFGGWGGACASFSTPRCRIMAHGDVNAQVTAAFATMPAAAGDQQELTLHTTFSGLPPQTSLAGFSCPPQSTCTARVATGTLVKLAAAGHSGWGGACVGNGFLCALVVDGPADINVPFVKYTPPDTGGYGLHIVVGGDGLVTDGHDIRDCTMRKTAHCEGTYKGGIVRLEAKPAHGNRFSRWISQGHVCRKKSASCIARINDPSGTTIVAVFKRKR